MDFAIRSLCSAHAHNVTSWSFLSCPCFKYRIDLQFWTGEFLNVPCGDGLHFYSGFAVCLLVYVKIKYKNVFLTKYYCCNA